MIMTNTLHQCCFYKDESAPSVCDYSFKSKENNDHFLVKEKKLNPHVILIM
jgi:hypothetical protein